MRTESKYFIKDNPTPFGIKKVAKSILAHIEQCRYKVKLNMIKCEQTEKKYKVSICAIFKNEAFYLKEWLEFNHLVGVEHFYMYNNKSEDRFEAVLEPYIKKGLVTLVE